MARRTFDVIDVCEIFTHWHAGRSKNEVAGSLGLARNTVRKYVAAAEAAGMVPGGPPVSQERWAELAREWFPELADTRLRQVTWPAIEVHRDYIVAQLAAGVTMATIYQRLRDERGLAAAANNLGYRACAWLAFAAALIVADAFGWRLALLVLAAAMAAFTIVTVHAVRLTV
jgi:transposase